MQEQTGVSWNKRFKKQFGSINKVGLGIVSITAQLATHVASFPGS